MRRHCTFPRTWHVSVSVVLLLAIVLPSAGRVEPATAASHLQPLLAQLATRQPMTPARVIVQTTGTDLDAEHLVARLGGHVAGDLALINAFTASIPAGMLPDLAAAPHVRWISLDGPMIASSTSAPCAPCVNTANLQNAYIQTIGADRVWNEAPYLQGQGVGVAVVDSGINSGLDDLQGANGRSRVVAQAKFNSSTHAMADQFGHGTHVAGIIGGNGADSRGAYIGVAPGVNLINVKVSDDGGAAAVSDVVSGLQWVLNNAAAYNIRVVNLSLNSSVADSYNLDPLDAACEILWNHGIVVVVSAGNSASGSNGGAIYAPANDPFVITVGALDERGLPAPYSSFGVTPDGVAKPDLMAPGTNIISTLASMGTALVKAHPDHVVGQGYFRMSGTSMAAPVVAGAAALLVQSNPALTPDQVKYRLGATAQPLGAGSGAGTVNVYAAVHSGTTASANTGLAPANSSDPGASRSPGMPGTP